MPIRRSFPTSSAHITLYLKLELSISFREGKLYNVCLCNLNIVLILFLAFCKNESIINYNIQEFIETTKCLFYACVRTISISKFFTCFLNRNNILDVQNECFQTYIFLFAKTFNTTLIILCSVDFVVVL